MIETQLPLWQILAANGAIALGAFVQSGAGFGMALVAVPLLALINTDFVPAPFILVGFLQVVIMAVQNRSGIVASQARNVLTGALAGCALAFLLLNQLQGERMGIVFGTTILAATMISCCGMKIPIVRPTLWSAGLLCGLIGTISGVGGPPLILLYQNEPGPHVRGTLGVIFAFALLFSMVALTWSGHLGQHEAILGAILVPGLVTGTLIAPPFRRYLDRTNPRPVLLTLAAAGAIALIVRDLI
jgi:uncharacterized membrane protein YfcA